MSSLIGGCISIRRLLCQRMIEISENRSSGKSPARAYLLSHVASAVRIETMDDKQLSRKLQTIGMGFFIKYFELINDPSVSGDVLVTRVVEAEKYNQAWTKIRVDYSRDIIREGHRNDALRKISRARLNKEITSKASRLLNDITASPSPCSPAPLPPRPPVSTQMVVAESILIDAAVLDYVRKATASELLALYATTLDELRERDIVRSANARGGRLRRASFCPCLWMDKSK